PARFYLLAVVQTADEPVRGEDHNSGEYGIEQRAASRLVGARDMAIASRAKVAFERTRTTQARSRDRPWHGSAQRRRLGLLALAEPRGLALQSAQIVQLRPADPAGAYDLDA